MGTILPRARYYIRTSPIRTVLIRMLTLMRKLVGLCDDFLPVGTKASCGKALSGTTRSWAYWLAGNSLRWLWLWWYSSSILQQPGCCGSWRSSWEGVFPRGANLALEGAESRASRRAAEDLLGKHHRWYYDNKSRQSRERAPYNVALTSLRFSAYAVITGTITISDRTSTKQNRLSKLTVQSLEFSHAKSLQLRELLELVRTISVQEK